MKLFTFALFLFLFGCSENEPTLNELGLDSKTNISSSQNTTFNSSPTNAILDITLLSDNGFYDFTHGSGWNNIPQFFYEAPATGTSQNISIILQQRHAISFIKNSSHSFSRRAGFFESQIQYRFRTPIDNTVSANSDNEFADWSQFFNIQLGSFFLDDTQIFTGAVSGGTTSISVPPASEIEFRFNSEELYDSMRVAQDFEQRWSVIQIFQPRLLITTISE